MTTERLEQHTCQVPRSVKERLLALARERGAAEKRAVSVSEITRAAIELGLATLEAK